MTLDEKWENALISEITRRQREEKEEKWSFELVLLEITKKKGMDKPALGILDRMMDNAW